MQEDPVRIASHHGIYNEKEVKALIRLIEPNPQYLSSYMEAYKEYKENLVTAYAFSDPASCDIFEKFDRYRFERNLQPNRVGAHFFWLVDDANGYFIGEITIRHRLTEDLSRYGGHIGYGVRFSQWNKGFGTQMLALALEEAKKLGLSKVLITCNDDNAGSARIMEKNGFLLADKVENSVDGRSFITRRYWKTL